MSFEALLDRVCNVGKSIPADPEVENSQERDIVIAQGVPCSSDSLLYRNSVGETAVSGGMQGIKRVTFFISDPRLVYNVNFNEDNWITIEGVRYEIRTIHVMDNMIGQHHYEVDAQTGQAR